MNVWTLYMLSLGNKEAAPAYEPHTYKEASGAVITVLEDFATGQLMLLGGDVQVASR